MSCCSKIICNGCVHSNDIRIYQEKLVSACPFCRHLDPKTKDEEIKNIMKRVNANDPVAMVQMGLRRYEDGDYDSAFKYVNKAAELGDAGAHYQLACFHFEGKGVEKDLKKEVYHLEQAAIGGHPLARYNLGANEKNNGRMDRAVKHWIIAAKLGYDASLDALKGGYEDGLVSKEDFAAALRAHQDTIEAMKKGEADMMMCCASCGTAEVDDIKLKTCTACKSVRYCSVKCQREHRPQHKRACKKRAAELHDEILFKQPESSHEGDCPICCLPISLDQKKSTLMSCCSKIICNGCVHSNDIRIYQEKLVSACPFCRHLDPKTKDEEIKNIMKRVNANDPVAMVQMGLRRYEDGIMTVHLNMLIKQPNWGKGVEKDLKKEVYHLEQAAIGGHPLARYNLGANEKNNGRMDRAVKHWIIAAKLGYDASLDALKGGYEDGLEAISLSLLPTTTGGAYLTMSTKNLEEQAADMMMMCCASCGTAEVDDIKLKTCTACKSVRYCSVKCQRDHRPQHKRACKKRAAELHDEILFKQPSSYLGDCPICFLPLPLDETKSTMMTCCSKVICGGCYHSNDVRIHQASLERTCPFCRHPAPKSKDEEIKNIMKRVELNDPVATLQMGIRHNKAGDYDGAFQYAKKAASLGDAGGHYELSIFYLEGQCVEKDEKKEVYHLEKAAIGGDAIARHNLGAVEKNNGRMDRAVKHWIIAAKLGCDASLDNLKVCFRGGLVTKEDFAAALRAHQAVIEATKSPQREAAEEARKERPTA
ncbi:Sel1-like repeat family protein [Skeletonema marinoi]|uniref:Sel1-like repeat family protein n=1 Tax=Skeletonema marinoi TaxID=267567 RepID=A0AAD9D5B0_9STRA|nr:Sel1-like repeat family protein [Skeletonema marinoi]